MTRAKFIVQEKLETQNGFTIKLAPVTASSKENCEFFKWTPGGEISLQIVSEGTARGFIVGKSYYVDFTPEPEEA